MGFAIAANGEQTQNNLVKSPREIVESIRQGGTPNQIQSAETAQIKKQIRIGEYRVEGRPIRIEQREMNKVRINAQGISADTELELEEDTIGSRTKFKAKLSNGKNSEIKIMPDVASATALQRLRLKVCSSDNNCSIELKEVGQGEQIRAAYEIRAEKKAKVFGFFKARMRLESQVDAETGEVIQTRRPWWSFLATEEIEETEELPIAEEEPESVGEVIEE